jgi:hypothetical protein
MTAPTAIIYIEDVHLMLQKLENDIDECMLTNIEQTVHNLPMDAWFHVSFELHDLIVYKNTRDICDDILTELIEQINQLKNLLSRRDLK